MQLRPSFARGLAVTLTGLICAAAPSASMPQPRDAPPSVAVLRHLSRVTDHINAAEPVDDLGRRTLGEAKISLAAATTRQAGGDYAGADQLAASADDLVRASDDAQPPPAPSGRDSDEAAAVLARVDLMASALAPVRTSRVRSLIELARGVEDGARRKAAEGASDARAAALRSEAIARAAVHVAIAEDPTVSPGLLPPPPPRPPRPPRPPGGGP